MKDTRPVYMGTFEQHRRQTNTDIEGLKANNVSTEKSIKALYDRTRKAEKTTQIVLIIAAASIGFSALAIYLSIIL